jgi:hypothetical protein
MGWLYSIDAPIYLPNNQMRKTGALECFSAQIFNPLLIWSG